MDDFHNDATASDGRVRQCKECMRAKARKWRAKKAKDPEWRKRFNKQNTKYRRGAGKVGQLFEAARQRAKRSDLEFNITKEDIVIPDTCPVLGIPIRAGKGRQVDVPKEQRKLVGATDNSPSVDRIDNSKGYTKDNIRVISWRANYLKNNATLDELVLLGEDAQSQLHYKS